MSVSTLNKQATPHQVPYGLIALLGGVYKPAALGGNIVVDPTYPNIMCLDPGGAHRDVTMPAEALVKGCTYLIFNHADAAENLVVKNDAAGAIATINQSEVGIIHCDGATWTVVGVLTIALS